ncbi:MAG: hypothetical protein JSR66_19700 [Proteobacteria bacterium]|nr:hypothetical protein [Pseudomonadota bacterium]
MSARKANRQRVGTEHYSVLASVISAIGAEDFAAISAGALCSFLGFELMAVFAHQRAAKAAVLFDNFVGAEARRGIANYAQFTHRVNPILQACALGVRRARDFALSRGEALSIDSHVELSPDEELGFRTVGWPRRQEEIGLYLSSGTALIELSFYRARGRRPAPDDKLLALQELAAPLTAAFERHRQLVSPRDAVGLTPREREVYHLLLLGCSSLAIALRLNISRHTVKDHRKRIFRKLRVASLGELFALQRSEKM